MTSLDFEYGSHTVQSLVHLYAAGQLNLEPGFQRNSVWSMKDRRSLIESMCQNFPIPSIFLYKSTDGGRLKYVVIDGKQRIESVLTFQGARGFRGERFAALIEADPSRGPEPLDWSMLCRRGLEHRVMGYKVQTVEVSGDFSDIVELFVRINSTGKRLTTAERRHAKYYDSAFLRHAGALAERRKQFFRAGGVLSAGQIARMKHVELVSELMASIVQRGLINKKSALDGVIAGKTVAPRALTRAASELTTTLNRVGRMFPKLRETRFRNSAEFYSLAMLIWKLESQAAVLTDLRRNEQAEFMLRELSNGVDAVREQVRRARGARPEQQTYANYLLTIQGDTDSLATRQRREALLESLLGGIFEKKDEKRLFTAEQRRILWNQDGPRECTKCGDTLSWSNFTVDHVRPHSRGGATALHNAALLCRPCNSRKGNRLASARTRRAA